MGYSRASRVRAHLPWLLLIGPSSAGALRQACCRAGSQEPLAVLEPHWYLAVQRPLPGLQPRWQPGTLAGCADPHWYLAVQRQACCRAGSQGGRLGTRGPTSIWLCSCRSRSSVWCCSGLPWACTDGAAGCGWPAGPGATTGADMGSACRRLLLRDREAVPRSLCARLPTAMSAASPGAAARSSLRLTLPQILPRLKPPPHGTAAASAVEGAAFPASPLALP